MLLIPKKEIKLHDIAKMSVYQNSHIVVREFN